MLNLLSIIVLTRNEEKNVLIAVNEIISKIKKQFEIIVVDDSTDSTPEIVRNLSLTHRNIKLAPQIGKGYTNAFITGLKNASGDAMVVLVGDLSDEIQDINEMTDKMEEGYDIVCASRYMLGGKKIGGNFFQNLFSSFVGKSLNLFINIPTCDISNSFKLYRTDIFKNIAITQSSFAISMQVTLKAFFLGYKITEIPTVWKNRAIGKSNFTFSNQTKHYMYWYFWGIYKWLSSRINAS